MRLSILPVLLAGAGAVYAEPIRVIADGASKTNANIRFGHALANANVNGNDDSVGRLVRPAVVMTTSTEIKSEGRHFCGASLREKAIRMSNAFRHALGLPLIETGDRFTFKAEVLEKSGSKGPMHGGVHILPMPFLGAPASEAPTAQPQGENVDSTKEVLADGSVVHIYRHHRVEDHRRMKHALKGSFLMRIHRAIMALGPWEGRAVAFVLGCGIGVLLRMFWVMAVLTYRTIRGERDEEECLDHEYIMFEQDAENIFVPPPEYTDEKVRSSEFEAQEAADEEMQTRA
ncbi:hypothetical protein BV22DRAFT_1003839 [Leucogyrophana mollusca]|uniref:Uncharacterized protein n=1 Tax=Leucogyrophana mollusca TaxID=85980 RepID=A0ACB8BUW4_9AGAM|nr:hypothetical protein BV22DRAFT_1003839 [Leucogyrophana mollusca]